VRVESYDLRLDIDYPGGTFRGDLSVSVEGAPELLELDCVDLTIEGVEFEGRAIEWRADRIRKKLLLPLPPRPAHLLRVRYSGSAGRDVLTGFYVSQFGERPLLTTMMEPVSCRRLLPCLDDPHFKAVFHLTVTVPEGVSVITNTAAVAQEEVGTRRRWTFAPTPKMSTYLLYLGVGPFEERAIEAEGVRIIAATAPGRSARTEWALRTSAQVLPAFREYYGLPYPIDKLHLVGVPDIGSGAMENWGAIAFSELAILVDDGTNPAMRRWATESIAHEIAHQWFGNLVTMEGFDDLWLNESFATFVAAKMQDRLGLRADAWGEFAIRTQSGWSGDSVRATHPIKFEVHDPEEIAEKFDEITYFKGAYVLRMLEAFVGEEPFRRGVQNYLQQHQFGNARGEELWRALAEVTGLPIERVARDWVERAGHPVVRVFQNDGGVRLEQHRFRFDGDPEGDPPRPIPLRLQVGGATRPVLFDTRVMDVPGVDPVETSINPRRAGFFRVWYEPRLRGRLLARASQLHDLELWGFLNDTIAFLYSGEATLDDYLQAIRATYPATGYASVTEVCGSLQALDPIFHETPDFRPTALGFYEAQLDRIALHPSPGESDTIPVVRQVLCEGRVLVDPAFARELASRMDSIDSADPALRFPIALAAASVGSDPSVDELLRRLASENENRAFDAACALGYLPTAGAVERALTVWKEPGVRTSCVMELVRGAARNPAGVDAAWRWIQLNLSEYERRAHESFYLPELVKSAVPYVGLKRPREVREFFEAHSFPDAKTATAQGLEMLTILERLRDSTRPLSAPSVPPTSS
jgi:tricorn protease interacting factor F2/3